MRVECICTGIILVHPNTKHGYPADLFQLGDVYIVNANMSGPGFPGVHPAARWIQPLNDYWERHGVFVFHKGDCVISQAAVDYIEE